MTDKLDVYGLDQATMTAVVRKLENKGGKKIGLEYLPFIDTPTEETVWDVLKARNPLADFRSADGEAKLVGRQAFDRMYADITSIAQKERFNVSDLRKIREAGQLPIVDGKVSFASQMGAVAKKKIRDAMQRSKDSVDNRVEWMQVNALLGKIESPSSSKVKFSVDYGITGGQTGIVPSILWSTVATATPLTDIQDWMDLVRENSGVEPNIIIMSSKALKYISQNTIIRDVLKYTNPFFSKAKAKEFIETELGITIQIYDTTYTNASGSTITRYLPEGKIIMLPSKDVVPDGIGDTARVLHPLADYTPGYYFWSEEKKDPYGINAGVGLDAFPRILHPEVLLNATVF